MDSDNAEQVVPATVSRRIVLHPGYVRSIKDGDQHYISALALARLYDVRLAECAVYNTHGFRPRSNDLHLWPRRDGNYPTLSDT